MAWKLDKKYSAEYPMIGAHRGFSACYPENTMIAFVEAAKIGVDMMEIDILWSITRLAYLPWPTTLPTLRSCAAI